MIFGYDGFLNVCLSTNSLYNRVNKRQGHWLCYCFEIIGGAYFQT